MNEQIPNDIYEGVAVLDIRRITTGEYPEEVLEPLRIIRKAAIAVIDTLGVISDYEVGDNSIAVWNDRVYESFGITRPFDRDRDVRESMDALYKLTRFKCGVAMTIALEFLSTHYPNEFALLELFSIGSKTKHFPDHTLNLLRHKDTEIYFAFSFSNAFNFDGTLPTYQGNEVQRLTCVFASINRSNLIKAISKLEGGRFAYAFHEPTYLNQVVQEHIQNPVEEHPIDF